MGTMRMSMVGEEIRADIGLLRAVATPYTETDSIRVEFAPGQGEVVRFEMSDGPNPVALKIGGTRFQRR